VAKPHKGPGYIVPFPEKYGGGTVLMRFLRLDRIKQLRAAAGGESGEYIDASTMASIAEVSTDIAQVAGISGDLSPAGFVPVDDDPPGRRDVFEAIGPQRRDLLTAAWIDANAAKPEDLAPFLASVQKVVF
jgi:hypothetical protein